MAERLPRVLRIAPRLDWRAVDPPVAVAPDASLGGLAAQLRRLAAGTAALGIEQTILAPRPAGAPRRARLGPLIGVHAVGPAGLPGTHRAALGWLAGVVAALARERPRPDVVHVHASGLLEPLLAVLAARVLMRRPVVLTLHCSARATYAVQSRRDAVVQVATRAAERLAVRAASRTLVLTERTRATVGGARTEVMPDCVDTAAFTRDDGRDRVFARRIGLDHARPLALFVGRISREKGWPALLDVVERLADRGLRLLVCGAGPESDAMQAEVARRGLADRIILAGPVEQEVVPAAFANADVLVLPSAHEELGSVLLEAMAAGVPSVAYDVGGIPEALRDGVTGVLVPAGDVAALAAGVARVLDASALREAVRRDGPMLAAERYSTDAAARRLAQIYAELSG